MNHRAILIAVFFVYGVQLLSAKWQPIKKHSAGRGKSAIAKMSEQWKDMKKRPVGEGGKSTHRTDTHIVGGLPVTELNTTHGFIATIQYFCEPGEGCGEEGYWFHQCAGTLVSRNKVLTMGQCGMVANFYSTRVGLGWQTLESLGHIGTQTYNVSNVEIHHRFRVKDWFPNDEDDDILLQTLNNIAILTLEQDVLPTATVYPVRINRQRGLRHEWCRVLGYGLGEDSYGVLKEAQVYQELRSVCNDKFRQLFNNKFRMTKNRVCISTFGGPPMEYPGYSCDMDYGGPVICNGRLWAIVEYPGCHTAQYQQTLTTGINVRTYKRWVQRKTPRPSCAATDLGCCASCSGEEVGSCLVGGCAGTEFGCCPGTTTAATGPDHEGCPQFSCSNATYGCCPCSGDRASKNLEFKGCPYRRTVILDS